MLTRRDSLLALLSGVLGCRPEPPVPALGSALSGAAPSGPIPVPEHPASPAHPALGNLEGVPERWRGALTSDEHIPRLGPPQPGDWLAEHHEPGQTFREYVASHPNRPHGTRRVVYLLPLGSLAMPLLPTLEVLRDYQSRYFGLETRVLPEVPVTALQAQRRINRQTGKQQLLAPDLIEALKLRLPRDACALLGLTLADLYPDPRWNFVFGQASLAERVGVYSFVRFHPSFYGEPVAADTPGLVARRSLKLMVHETGHLFGLLHCKYYGCFINGSNHLAETDSRPMHACPVCLRKLQWALGFEPLARYARLHDFYREHALDAEAEWVKRRLAAIAAAG